MARPRRSRKSALLTAIAGEGRAATGRSHLLIPATAGLVLGAAAVAILTACTAPQPRVPGPPIVAGGAAPVAQRPVRPTPAADRTIMLAQGDVVEAGEAFVQALYDADDATAMAYQPGFGTKLRENEDTYRLVSLSGRPITWSEFGYADADADLEFAEIVARVESRKSSEAGAIYYKLAFRRSGETVQLDQWSKRVDVR